MCVCTYIYIHIYTYLYIYVARVFPATVWMRTVANAWNTSTRMHEDVQRTCIFVCNGLDSLQHHLCCRCLWDIASFASGIPPKDGVLERLSIIPPYTRDSVSLRALTFLVYHNFKHISSDVYKCLTPGLTSWTISCECRSCSKVKRSVSSLASAQWRKISDSQGAVGPAQRLAAVGTAPITSGVAPRFIQGSDPWIGAAR